MFLSQNSKNVVGIHCNAGKGRTGSIICVLLDFMGIIKGYNNVNKFYEEKRFVKVTRKSQLLYMRNAILFFNSKLQY